jgi:hypothetical protein
MPFLAISMSFVALLALTAYRHKGLHTLSILLEFKCLLSRVFTPGIPSLRGSFPDLASVDEPRLPELARAFRVTAFVLHCFRLFTRYVALVDGLLPYSLPAALCTEGVTTLYRVFALLS